MTGSGPFAWPPSPIRTARLVLREPEAWDRESLIDLFSSPEVGTYIGGPQDRDELRRVMPDPPRRRPGLFVVDLAGAMIGLVMLDPRDPEQQPQVAPAKGVRELGYLFRPKAWGHGYAAEACGAALTWFGGQSPQGQVVLTTRTANHRAMRVAAKLGFTEVTRFQEWGAEQWFGSWRPAPATV
jgi:RimJ/RimL family protein N-acetyltransferase